MPQSALRWLRLSTRYLLLGVGLALVAYGLGVILFLLATLTPYFTFGDDAPTWQIIAGALLYLAAGYGVIQLSSHFRRR